MPGEQVKAGALPLTVLPVTVGICQLPPASALPEWTRDATQLLSVTRTPTELSIVADEDVIRVRWRRSAGGACSGSRGRCR